MGSVLPLTNSIAQRFARLMPGLFGLSSKHDHYRDFGWKEELTFDDFHKMYSRNGLAAAAIDKTTAKTWESEPALWETEKPGDTTLEKAVARRFTKLRVWQSLAHTDTRSMVGAYAGAILILADGKKLDQPVDRVPGALEGLAGIIPAWEGQLSVVEWNTDVTSPEYGQPVAYQFDEAAVDNHNNVAGRHIRIHPDRVLIWSEDGSLNGRSTLEPGFNDLIDAEKVKGAGGEGFWKTARGAPVIEAGAGMSPEDVVKAFGAQDADEARKKLNERADDFQAGFDKMLMLGGMTAKPMQITLPAPEHFFNIPVMSFAASMQIPVRILIGNQTGERASTEDATEWARVCMGRRSKTVLPLIYELIDRLVRWGILPAKDWTVGWADLLDETPDQRLDRAAKMADINAKTLPGDEPCFTPNQILEMAGFEPMPDGDDHGTAEDKTTEADDPRLPVEEPEEDEQ